MTAVAGYCPMGCGETLTVSLLGIIRCTDDNCPRSTAVHEILADPETEHIVELEHGAFVLLHPLRERLDGGLFGCEAAAWMSGLSGPPAAAGRYRLAWREGADWSEMSQLYQSLTTDGGSA